MKQLKDTETARKNRAERAKRKERIAILRKAIRGGEQAAKQAEK